MENKKAYCTDVYGERLNIGDEVIPVMEEALIIGRKGIISKIEYIKEYNDYFITIVDKTNRTLLEGVNATYYTTKERFEEREHGKYPYILNFLDEKFCIKGWVPLNNNTDPNYDIPKWTKAVTIWTNYIIEKTECGSTRCCAEIYCIFFEDGVTLCRDPESRVRYLQSNKDYMSYHPIFDRYRKVKNFEELKHAVKKIIKTVNNMDLSEVTNGIVEEKEVETEINKIEKVLASKLKSH